MNKTRRSHRGGFLFSKKNKNKKSNTFEVQNPIKIKQEERKKQEKAKEELNKMVKNLEKLFGGRRTKKQRKGRKTRRRH
jgi:hypothetical protein